MLLQHRAGLTFQQRERAAQHVVLELGIVGLAQRPTEWELTVQDARGLHSFGHPADRRDRHGGQAGSLEDVGERTHGTRAEGSNRGQEDDVHTVGLEFCGAGRTGIVPERGDIVGLIAGKRVVFRGH